MSLRRSNKDSTTATSTSPPISGRSSGEHQNNSSSNHEINIVMPVNAQPTEVLAARFAAWRKIIRAFNVYFKEVASVQEEVVRHNIRLGHAVSFPFFSNGTSEGGAAVHDDRHHRHFSGSGSGGGDGGPSSGSLEDNEEIRQMFLEFGDGSIADVPGNVIQFHRSQAAAASRTSKELSQNVIPRLEDLRRDLLVKIKEIKSLSSDFKNSVAREQGNTSKELQQYINAIDVLNRNPSLLPAKHDPYLIKMSLQKQLTKQVNEENYLLEAFLNLQGSGKELEKVVSQEIQQALAVYGKLMGIQAKNLTDISNKVLEGYVSKDSTMEWDSFISRDANFVDPSLKPRRVADIAYPHQDSLLSMEVKSGYLERRSKYLKSYSRAWYVLTPSFLHEFKSSDRKRDSTPVMSLSLDECQLSHDTSHKKSSSSTSVSHKFILNAKQQHNGSNGRGHNWVFRAESKEKLDEWFAALSKLTQLGNPIERAKSFRKPANENLVVPGAGVAENSSENFSTKQTDSSNHHHAVAAATQTPPVGGTTGTEEFPSVSSPVPSDTSAVTSTGEPYRPEDEDAEEETEEGGVKSGNGATAAGGAAAGAIIGGGVAAAAATNTSDSNAVGASAEESNSRPQRGRFPSEVKLDSQPVDANRATDSESLHREAAGFIVPSDKNNNTNNYSSNNSETVVGEGAVDDDASVFSYDLEHPSASTFKKGNDDFKPVDSDLPVSVERRLTQTSHKMEDPELAGIGPARKSTLDEPVEETLSRRRNSAKSLNRPLSRRATGSYGTGDELKPLTKNVEDNNGALFFAGGLPQTTGGKDA